MIIAVISVFMFMGLKSGQADNLDIKGKLLCNGQPAPGVFVEAWDVGQSTYSQFLKKNTWRKVLQILYHQMILLIGLLRTKMEDTSFMAVPMMTTSRLNLDWCSPTTLAATIHS